VRYLVCKCHDGSYTTLTLFDGETVEETTDRMDGSPVTVVRRDGEVVNSAGELCADLESKREARLMEARLTRVAQVMES
jgi:hypothetical protein